MEKSATKIAQELISKYIDYNVCHQVCNDILKTIEVNEKNMKQIDLYLDVKCIINKMQLQ